MTPETATPRLKVFYDPHMVAPSVRSFSPSAGKPAALIEYWRRIDMEDSLDITSFDPLTPEEISIAHDPDFVRGVLAGEIKNGFGNADLSTAETLRWTNGAMLAAARYARLARRNALAPVSGFHHASYQNAAGFCTFNGLMIAALTLLAEGAKQVAILDCDAHFGDGSEDILDRTFGTEVREAMTINREGFADHPEASILHYTYGAHYGYGAPRMRTREAEHFFDRLPHIVDSMRKADVILYQAGADPHIDDPLGGMLTGEELAERDRVVFERAALRGVPIAWDLAGGYRRDKKNNVQPVLDTHTATLKACLGAMNQGASR